MMSTWREIHFEMVARNPEKQSNFKLVHLKMITRAILTIPPEYFLQILRIINVPL